MWNPQCPKEKVRIDIAPKDSVDNISSSLLVTAEVFSNCIIQHQQAHSKTSVLFSSPGEKEREHVLSHPSDPSPSSAPKGGPGAKSAY